MVYVWLGGGKITLIHSCMSYEEEDTCMSYEEEDTRRRQDALIHSCPPFDSVPRPPFMNPPAHSRMGRKGCGTGRVGGPGPKGLRTQTGGHRDTLLGVTDGVSTRKNGLVEVVFYAQHDAIKIRSGQPVGRVQFRPAQSLRTPGPKRDEKIRTSVRREKGMGGWAKAE